LNTWDESVHMYTEKQQNDNVCTKNIRVPDVRVWRCLEPEGNGVSSGEEGEGGPGPPCGGEDKQSTPSKEGDNMEKEEEARTGWA
jgi:hypothetical protein